MLAHLFQLLLSFCSSLELVVYRLLLLGNFLLKVFYLELQLDFCFLYRLVIHSLFHL